MKKEKKSFFEKAKNAKKVLYLDLGFLGDSIHQIPALRCIREAMPEAEIHAMFSSHILSIMDVVPWIDKFIGYPRFPKGPAWYKDISRVMKLRKEKYDVIINLNGSDRSSLLTWAIGSPLRLGRIPPKVPAFWRWCFTDTVFTPRGDMPVYRQSWESLKAVGFPGGEAKFDIDVPKRALEKVDILLDGQNDFIHLSPFTTQDHKELPVNKIAQFVNQIVKDHPGLKVVISCAPNDRECSKFEELLSHLNTRPWKAFPGTLSLVQLSGLISRSNLHIGGDSGALHVAFMTGVPTISWFRNYNNRTEWMPDGPMHRSVVGEESENGLQGIELEELVAGFNQLYNKNKQNDAVGT